MSADSFPASLGRPIIDALVATIEEHAAELSELDGAIGDGDHGVNMRKGFLLVRSELDGEIDLAAGLSLVGETLMTRIGGAMGPLYGSFFTAMGEACSGVARVDASTLAAMLDAGREAIEDLGGARVGDKTLLDALVPACDSFGAAVASGASFREALDALAQGAEDGKESTRDLVAKVGRASRLGERSRGVLDAGATSCSLLLGAMARAMRDLLEYCP